MRTAPPLQVCCSSKLTPLQSKKAGELLGCKNDLRDQLTAKEVKDEAAYKPILTLLTLFPPSASFHHPSRLNAQAG